MRQVRCATIDVIINNSYNMCKVGRQSQTGEGRVRVRGQLGVQVAGVRGQGGGSRRNNSNNNNNNNNIIINMCKVVGRQGVQVRVGKRANK
jgi:hypothetical protein